MRAASRRYSADKIEDALLCGTLVPGRKRILLQKWIFWESFSASSMMMTHLGRGLYRDTLALTAEWQSICNIGQKVEDHCQNKIRGQQLHTFEPICFSVRGDLARD